MTMEASPLVGHPGTMLFEAVVANDHETLINLYATSSRNSLVSYLSMKSRWAQQHEFYTNAGKFGFARRGLLKSLNIGNEKREHPLSLLRDAFVGAKCDVKTIYITFILILVVSITFIYPGT